MKRNLIMSLFGEIEEIVAKQMMQEGKGITKLAPTLTVGINDCPHSAVHNARGEKARMVIVLPPQLKMEFERRVDDLLQ